MERSEGAVVTRMPFAYIGTADCKFACNPAGSNQTNLPICPLIVAPARLEHRRDAQALITVTASRQLVE